MFSCLFFLFIPFSRTHIFIISLTYSGCNASAEYIRQDKYDKDSGGSKEMKKN